MLWLETPNCVKMFWDMRHLNLDLHPAFLPYRDDDGNVTSGQCETNQVALDQDYFSDSFEYADSLRSGDLRNRISHRITEIDTLIFQSWHVNPLSNLIYMDEVRKYANRP